ncbi:MAG: hypothetical protein MRY83_15425 [Flavobacteriales bacterium]|nr:hypothetical protein [Flavobacteriales bacterium]
MIRKIGLLVTLIFSCNLLLASAYDGEQHYENTEDYKASIIISELTNVNPDSALTILKDLELNCIRIENISGLCYTYLLKAYVYSESSLSNNDSTIVYLRKAINLAIQLDNVRLITQSNNDLGAFYMGTGELDSAFYYLNIASQIAEKEAFGDLHFRSVIRLAELYSKIGNEIISESMLEEVLSKKDQVYSDAHQRNIVVLSLVEYKIKLNKLTEASDLIEKAKNHFNTVKNHFWKHKVELLRATIKYNEGSLDESLEIIEALLDPVKSNQYVELTYKCYLLRHHILLRKYRSKALSNAEEVQEYYKQIGYLEGQNLVDFFKSEILFATKDYSEAAKTASKIDVDILTKFDDALVLKYYTLLSESEKNMSNGAKSERLLNDYLKFKANKDSLQFRFKLSINDIERFMIRKQNQLDKSQLELQYSKTKTQLLITLFLLAAILIILIFLKLWNNRKKAYSQNQKLEFQLKQLETTVKEKSELLKKIKDQTNSIDTNIDHLSQLAVEGNWLALISQFKLVHKSFLSDLGQKANGKLTKTDERLAILLKLNLSNKEILEILNITEAGFKKAKTRLRNRLNLEASTYLSKYIRSKF